MSRTQLTFARNRLSLNRPSPSASSVRFFACLLVHSIVQVRRASIARVARRLPCCAMRFLARMLQGI